MAKLDTKTVVSLQCALSRGKTAPRILVGGKHWVRDGTQTKLTLIPEVRDLWFALGGAVA